MQATALTMNRLSSRRFCSRRVKIVVRASMIHVRCGRNPIHRNGGLPMGAIAEAIPTIHDGAVPFLQNVR